MSAHADERDESDDDEDQFDQFEDVMDHFIASRMKLMEITGTKFRTRDAFVAQTLLLVEIAVLGIPDDESSLRDVQLMIEKFHDDGWSAVSKPSQEWCERVIRLAGEHIHGRRLAYEHEHRLHCTNCNPPENRNN